MKLKDHTSVNASPSKRDPIEAWLDVFVRMLGVRGEEALRIRDELEDHLRTRVDDLLITGVSEPEAVRRAVAELGESAELAGRFRMVMKPRRRMLMQASMIGLAGTVVAVGAMSLAGLNGGRGGAGNGGLNGAGNGAAPVVTRAESVPQSGAGAGTVVERVPEGRAPVVASGVAPHDPALRRYDLSGLAPVGETIASSWQESSITQSMLRLVTPSEWEENGGDSVLQIVGNTLFVNASDETHEGVGWMLASLREDLDNQRRQAQEAEHAAARERQDVLAEIESELARVTEQVLAMQDQERELNERSVGFPPDGRHPAPGVEFTPEQQARYDEWEQLRLRWMRDRRRLTLEMEDLNAVRNALQSQFARLRSEVYAVNENDRVRARQAVQQMQRMRQQSAQNPFGNTAVRTPGADREESP